LYDNPDHGAIPKTIETDANIGGHTENTINNVGLIPGILI
jgi:hypothetical protein